MEKEHIAQVRRFNRTVTQHVGALEDSYLKRGRPLGEARLIHEIGADGIDIRRLRERLKLDSGYVSRLLRSLEGQGLVETGHNAADRRRRGVVLTPKGPAEHAT
jgi:DNA-binding MarR family transcriptional regulator